MSFRVLSHSLRNAMMASRNISQSTALRAELQLTFASPTEVYYNQEKVHQVDVPGLNGSFGILAEHVPTLAVLKPGVLQIYEASGQQPKRFFVSSGSVTVNADASVQVLAQEAHPVENLDPSAIKSGMQQASQAMSSAGNEKAKAEAQIAVECYEALDKAVAGV